MGAVRVSRFLQAPSQACVQDADTVTAPFSCPLLSAAEGEAMATGTVVGGGADEGRSFRLMPGQAVEVT